MAPLHPDSPLGRVAHHLSAHTDPRSTRRPVHLRDEILLMAPGTFFTGGRTFVDMKPFARSHEDWLRIFMDLPGGLPSQDTFGRVFAARDARQFEDALRHWCAGVGISPEPAGLPPPARRHLQFKGSVVTADAVHAQSATATQIIRQGGNYVLCGKGTRPVRLCRRARRRGPRALANGE